jgi:hypothetical protein
LREASPSQNQHNSGRQKNNVSGCTGVHSRGAAGWGAEIRIAKQRVWLGTFPTYELAVIARRGAEERLLGEFAPGR